MADPIAVATKKAKAELRIKDVAPAIAKRFGVDFSLPAVNQRNYPDLYAAELMERVADLLEAIDDRPNEPQPKDVPNEQEERRRPTEQAEEPTEPQGVHGGLAEAPGGGAGAAGKRPGRGKR